MRPAHPPPPPPPPPTPTPAPAPLPPERKLRLREAQAEVKREIDAYRAEREARLRTQQPEAAALDVKVLRVTSDMDRCAPQARPSPRRVHF